MMKKLLATAAAAMALSAGDAQAQTNWSSVGITTDGTSSISIAMPSVIDEGNGLVRAWVREDDNPPDRGVYYTSVSMMEFNCTSRQWRSLQDTRYREPGMAGQSDTRSGVSAWQYTPPGTMGDMLVNALCGPAHK